MCGIAGLIGPGAESRQDAVRRMNAIQRSRGPDDEGLFVEPRAVLGHVRLAILDLTSAGHQPMSTPDGRFTVVYNGEIYNYLELQDELGGRETFRSRTDTEVLLRAYARWGAGCLERLRGMFAFAIWDRQEHTMFLARDRFGIKPLHYAQHEGRWLFASEIKALLTGGVEPRPDSAVIAEYLCTSLYDHREATFFAGIRRLPPGHHLSIRADGRLDGPHRYYNLPSRVRPLQMPFDEAKARLLELLREAMRLHLRADVPVGINLSGGVDSSVLLALAAEDPGRLQRLRAFTIDYPGTAYSERPWVEQLLERFPVPCTFTTMTAEACATAIPAMVWCQDEPFGGIPTVAWHSVYQTARGQGIPVLLDGSGVDDCFAGYRANVLRVLIRRMQERPRAEWSVELQAFCRVWQTDEVGLRRELDIVQAGSALAMDGTHPVHLQAVREPYRRLADRTFEEPRAFTDSSLHEELYAGVRSEKLPRMLRFSDRVSMAFSCEMRVPFLDHQIVELAFSFPEAFLVHGGWNKYIFREAVAGLLPESLRLAPKRSVQSPQREWFTRGPLADLLESALRHPSAFLEDVLDVRVAREAYERFRSRPGQNSNHLWQWLNLDLWHRRFFQAPVAHRTALAREPARVSG